MRWKDAFFHQALDALEVGFFTPELRFRAFDIVFRPLDLFRPRSALELVEPRLRGIERGLVLIELGPVLAVLEPNDGLALLDAIALLHSNPRNAARDLRSDLNLVMRHDVARRHQHGRRGGRFHARAHGFDFGRRSRVAKRKNSEDSAAGDRDGHNRGEESSA